jgi:hypothetical protein
MLEHAPSASFVEAAIGLGRPLAEAARPGATAVRNVAA